MERRTFVASGLALLGARTSRAATARIDIRPDDKIGVIHPDIYGHFVEHLGGCVYDGIWVGENSKVPNYGGIRKALVDSLKALKPSVIRWPGGCFADSYNWRDGIGPRNQRPKRTNFWANTPYMRKAPDGPQKYDPNHFGTNEFARFCRLVGAEPYFAANLRSLPARDFYEWIEYCNSPAGTTTLAEMRAAGGDREPLNVQYWGVGNESWGCGGNFKGDEYAIEYRRFVEWVPQFSDERLKYIAAGPNGNDVQWTRSFMTKLFEKRSARNRIYGFALHYYTGTVGKRSATEFTTDDWYALLVRSNRMEELIRTHWTVMGEVDTEHRIKLAVDEWGAWHDTADIVPGFLFGYYPTLRDALVSGITLDTFNRHADKVIMGNAAQLVNNIHTSYIAAGDKFCETPVYHVFAMYAPHYGNTAVRADFNAPPPGVQSALGLPGLAGSCSMRDKHCVVTAVNPHLQDALDTEIVLQSGNAANLRATVLTSTDMKAHNTLDQPKVIQPKAQDAKGSGASFTFRFAPASVTRLEFDLS